MNEPGRLSPTPPAPKNLGFGGIRLCYERTVAGQPSRGLVPAYHFRILKAQSPVDVGHLNFRIGETQHVLLCAGHIGFEVAEEFRGNGYASQACRAVAPFVRSFYEYVTITCDPDNVASMRTIERLGAEFIDVVAVPPQDPHYQRGSRHKRRYRWRP